MNDSTRSFSPSLVVVTLLGIILILLPLGAQGFAQSEEKTIVHGFEHSTACQANACSPT